ncbi:MAG: FecR family protein [Lewinella sp.]
MQRYLPEIASLAADSDFVAWVHGKRESEDNRWAQLANGDEEQRIRLQQAIDFVKDLDLIPAPIPRAQIDTDWQRLVQQRPAAAPVRSLHLRPRPRKWMAIAATLLLLLTSGLAWTYVGSRADYHTDFAERSSVKLDDGTIIDLQANSYLYVEEWSPQKRAIRLEGEAFFAVAHAPDRPFVVRAGKAKVAVLGTRFNVLNRNDTPVVALESGSVSLQSASAKTTMTPGEVATVSEAGKIQQQANKDLRYYTSWREGHWVLDETPLSDIAARITANFGVEVVFKDIHFADKKLSGSLPADELNELINALSRLLDQPVTSSEELVVFE